MGETSHHVEVHPRAQSRIDKLSRDFDTDELKERIFDAATHRDPRKHRCVDGLEGYPGYLKLRSGDLRAICRLDRPDFQVLLVDKRSAVYDRLETAVRRARGERDLLPDGGGCPNCGGPLRREGRCETCTECGRSTCGGGRF